jgi:hypothetical protein
LGRCGHLGVSGDDGSRLAGREDSENPGEGAPEGLRVLENGKRRQRNRRRRSPIILERGVIDLGRYQVMGGGPPRYLYAARGNAGRRNEMRKELEIRIGMTTGDCGVRNLPRDHRGVVYGGTGDLLYIRRSPPLGGRISTETSTLSTFLPLL